MSEVGNGTAISEKSIIMHYLSSLSFLFPLTHHPPENPHSQNFWALYEKLKSEFLERAKVSKLVSNRYINLTENFEHIFSTALRTLHSYSKGMFSNEDPLLLRCFLQEFGHPSGADPAEKFVYIPKPLFYSEDILFPVPYNHSLLKSSREERDKLFMKLYRDLSIAFKNHINEPARLYSLTYYLFWIYLWSVPCAMAIDGKKYYSDRISLFEFLRLYSIYTLSLFSEYNYQLLLDHREEFPLEKLSFLHIKGDVSGIQNFIAGTLNISGTARRLRGKSFFLSLLDRLTSLYLLRGLGYPFGHIIYSSGGHFEIILGFDENEVSLLDTLTCDLERYFLSSFHGELGLVTVKKIYTYRDLFEKGYDTLISQVLFSLGEAKKRKFINLLNKISEEELSAILNRDLQVLTQKRICPACGKYLFLEEEGETCFWCQTFFELGKTLPEAKVLIHIPCDHSSDTLLPEKLASLSKGSYDLGPFGKIFLAEKPPPLSKLDDNVRVFLLNDTRIVQDGRVIADGFVAIEQHIPFSGPGHEERTSVTFEALAEASRGDAKLAYVKGDLDNLGHLLQMGVRASNLWLAISSLSTYLDLFFSGYLRYLLSTSTYREHIYTLYAGGDDFLLIGSWDKVLKFLNILRSKFYHYTGKNEKLHFSAGIIFTHPNYPVRLALSLVNDAIENAKQKKPAINLFDETISWNSYSLLFDELTNQIYEHLLKDNIERTFLYKLYQLLYQYRNYDLKGDIKKYSIYPKFYYYLNRNILSKKVKKLIIEWLLDVERDYQVREEALVKLKYVLTLSRRR